jgi:phage shock protein A
MSEQTDPEREVDEATAEAAGGLDELEAREDRLEHQIEEVREDWEELKQDRSVPGAQDSRETEDTTRQDLGEPPPGTG